MFFETKRSIEKNYFYTQTDENLNFVSHVHNSYECIIVTEGELECTVYQKTIVLRPGMAMLILPNHVHNYRTREFSRSFLCIFSADYVGDFHNEIKNTGYTNAVFRFVDHDVIEFLKNKQTNKYLIRSALYNFCGIAYPHLETHFDAGERGELSVKLLYYIQENYDKQISLKQIAAEMGYNYTYLSNTFNKIFGCGFSKFVNRFRAENAAELLLTTNQSMAQISIACGFESIRSFNEQFKLIYNLSPTDYRNAHRAQDKNEGSD